MTLVGNRPAVPTQYPSSGTVQTTSTTSSVPPHLIPNKLAATSWKSGQAPPARPVSTAHLPFPIPPALDFPAAPYRAAASDYKPAPSASPPPTFRSSPPSESPVSPSNKPDSPPKPTPITETPSNPPLFTIPAHLKPSAPALPPVPAPRYANSTEEHERCAAFIASTKAYIAQLAQARANRPSAPPIPPPPAPPYPPSFSRLRPPAAPSLPFAASVLHAASATTTTTSALPPLPPPTRPLTLSEQIALQFRKGLHVVGQARPTSLDLYEISTRYDLPAAETGYSIDEVVNTQEIWLRNRSTKQVWLLKDGALLSQEKKVEPFLRQEEGVKQLVHFDPKIWGINHRLIHFNREGTRGAVFETKTVRKLFKNKEEEWMLFGDPLQSPKRYLLNEVGAKLLPGTYLIDNSIYLGSEDGYIFHYQVVNGELVFKEKIDCGTRERINAVIMVGETLLFSKSVRSLERPPHDTYDYLNDAYSPPSNINGPSEDVYAYLNGECHLVKQNATFLYTNCLYPTVSPDGKVAILISNPRDYYQFKTKRIYASYSFEVEDNSIYSIVTQDSLKRLGKPSFHLTSYTLPEGKKIARILIVKYLDGLNPTLVSKRAIALALSDGSLMIYDWEKNRYETIRAEKGCTITNIRGCYQEHRGELVVAYKDSANNCFLKIWGGSRYS